jgi:hypothetical protein
MPLRNFNKKIFWLLVPVVIVACISVTILMFPRINTWMYDCFNDDNEVNTYYDAKKVLEQFPTVSFHELPSHLQKVYHDPKYSIEKMISGNRFYIIPRKDLFKKIFANNRINNLVSKEQQISGFWYFQNNESYLCINDKIIESLFLLQDKLVALGYNPKALVINSGYRSPAHNLEVKGATMSQHLFGKAIDLRIGDINNDGRADQIDKQIVYKILNSSVIANKGGLGFYPKTMILHMDVRGVNARWDSYKRK